MQREKCFVLREDVAVIRCPFCGFSKAQKVTSFRGKRNCFKAKCRCANLFEVELDFRQHYRKVLELPVSCVKYTEKGATKIDTILLDISMSGIRLSDKDKRFSVGDMLEVSFCLDSKQEKMIKKKVIIRNIFQEKVGCEFTEKEDFAKEIGFFLMR